jgi:hypothetical protein
MLKKIKELCLSLGIFSLFAVPIMMPAAAYAVVDTSTINNSICGGTKGEVQGVDVSQCDDTTDGSGIEAILRKVIQIFSIVVGFVAVVMIIIGGIRYITSGGDSGNISSAKNTIIYAIIGLIIVALAQVLVHYVLKNVNNATTN